MMMAGETEVLGENLPQCHFVTTNPTCCPDANPGSRGGKPVSNRLSYGTAFYAGFFLGLLFDPEDGGDMLLRNVG
jgi:hypothetical protein